jgi:hypothetical protein
MLFIITYSVIAISSLFIYLTQKKYLTKEDVNFTKKQLSSLFELKSKQEINNSNFEKLNEKNKCLHPSTLLTKSILHLDFISQLESVIDDSGDYLLSEDLLAELNQNKIKAQLSIIKSSNMLSKLNSIAA